MLTKDFFYDLPPELIAQSPAPKRDASRLLVYHRSEQRVEHRVFSDITEFLRPGDTLVLNHTRVLPARLHGCREDTGGKVELLLLHPLSDGCYEVLIKPGRRVKEGCMLSFGDGALRAEVLSRTDAGGRIVCFVHKGEFELLLQQLGEMPLPPYIKQTCDDPSRYQTVYARVDGSAAAPTAGLHFTPELLQAIEQKGVCRCNVLLHVGLGTFRPVSVDDVRDHDMHAEYFSLDVPAANMLNETRANGGRIVAVGTTSVRTLESCYDADADKFVPNSGWTKLFITPGYTFHAVDALITNFHLPGSTLLMLVSAFAGREQVLELYHTAVQERYRFFSFGDAMLIL